MSESHEDRRAEKAIPMHILQHISDAMERINATEKERHQVLEEKIDAIERRVGSLITSINSYMDKQETLLSAFPNQDPEGHRAAHEQWLAESKAKKEFYDSLKKEVAKYGILGLAAWIAFHLWAAFLQGPHK
jgi:hypothetical protein